MKNKTLQEMLQIAGIKPIHEAIARDYVDSSAKFDKQHQQMQSKIVRSKSTADFMNYGIEDIFDSTMALMQQISFIEKAAQEDGNDELDQMLKATRNQIKNAIKDIHQVVKQHYHGNN